MAKKRTLVEAQGEYIRLLGLEIDELAGYAASHGWQSKRVEEGKRLRAEIRKLRQRDAG